MISVRISQKGQNKTKQSKTSPQDHHRGFQKKRMLMINHHRSREPIACALSGALLRICFQLGARPKVEAHPKIGSLLFNPCPSVQSLLFRFSNAARYWTLPVLQFFLFDRWEIAWFCLWGWTYFYLLLSLVLLSQQSSDLSYFFFRRLTFSCCSVGAL